MWDVTSTYEFLMDSLEEQKAAAAGFVHGSGFCAPTLIGF
jgi:hypothetical protein